MFATCLVTSPKNSPLPLQSHASVKFRTGVGMRFSSGPVGSRKYCTPAASNQELQSVCINRTTNPLPSYPACVPIPATHVIWRDWIFQKPKITFDSTCVTATPALALAVAVATTAGAGPALMRVLHPRPRTNRQYDSDPPSTRHATPARTRPLDTYKYVPAILR